MEEQKSRCAVWQCLKGWPIHLIIILLMVAILFFSFKKICDDVQTKNTDSMRNIVRCDLYVSYTHIKENNDNQAINGEKQKSTSAASPLSIILSGGILDKLGKRDIFLLIMIWVAGIILTHSLYRVLKQLNNHIDDWPINAND